MALALIVFLTMVGVVLGDVSCKYDPSLKSVGTWAKCDYSTCLRKDESYTNNCLSYCISDQREGYWSGYCWSNGYCYCEKNYRDETVSDTKCDPTTGYVMDQNGGYLNYGCQLWCSQGAYRPNYGQFDTGYCNIENYCVCQDRRYREMTDLEKSSGYYALYPFYGPLVTPYTASSIDQYNVNGQYDLNGQYVDSYNAQYAV